MAASRSAFRSGRTAGDVVAVTGAASAAGCAVTSALARWVGRDGGPSRVIAVDRQRAAVDGVRWRLGDLADPAVVGLLEGASVVVHCAAMTELAAALAVPPATRRQRAVREAQAVTTAAAAVGARRLLAVTSAMVFGARPDNPVPLPEDTPLRAPSDTGIVGDLLAVEEVLADADRCHPGLAVTVMRPAALVGPGVDTIVTRHFAAPRLLSVRGATPAWQFCHVDDLGEAVAVALAHELTGPLTAGTTPPLGQAEVEALAGMRRVDVPAAIASGTARRLHRLGVLPMPAEDLAFVLHPWVVGSQRLRAAGWTPAWDGAACLAVLLEGVRGQHAVAGRTVDRRDAAVGAAGAAVAAVATAALVRGARARKGRRRG